MRILVTADTHIPDWYHELPGRLVEDARKSDLVLLAGDIVSRQVIDTLASCALVEAAYGNFCDDELKRSLPSKKTLELSGRKVGLTTAISGRGTTLMKNLSVSSMEGSMCSFTATRIILIKEKLRGILVLEPGSPLDTKFTSSRSYAILNLDDEISVEFVPLP